MMRVSFLEQFYALGRWFSFFNLFHVHVFQTQKGQHSLKLIQNSMAIHVSRPIMTSENLDKAVFLCSSS